MQLGRYGGLPVGTFNTGKSIFSGFSDGAQMTSWLIELRARKELPPGLDIVAGVFLSGGSHRCYMSPPDAVSNCATCSDTAGNCGGGSGSRGCSLTASPLCCSYCCPANFTEVRETTSTTTAAPLLQFQLIASLRLLIMNSHSPQSRHAYLDRIRMNRIRLAHRCARELVLSVYRTFTLCIQPRTPITRRAFSHNLK
jgi:hypothetical protein